MDLLTHLVATAAGLAMTHSSRCKAASQVLNPVVPPTTSEVDSFSTARMLSSFCKGEGLAGVEVGPG